MLPENTHWIIVYKDKDLYALDAPVVSWSEELDIDAWESSSISRILDDVSMEEIMDFLVWIANDCPEPD